MAVSFAPDEFYRHSSRATITERQAAFLKAKGIEEGISDGIDQHWIESWLFSQFGINVDDVEDLTVDQFRTVLGEMGWNS